MFWIDRGQCTTHNGLCSWLEDEQSTLDCRVLKKSWWCDFSSVTLMVVYSDEKGSYLQRSLMIRVVKGTFSAPSVSVYRPVYTSRLKATLSGLVEWDGLPNWRCLSAKYLLQCRSINLRRLYQSKPVFPLSVINLLSFPASVLCVFEMPSVAKYNWILFFFFYVPRAKLILTTHSCMNIFKEALSLVFGNGTMQEVLA